MSTAAQVLANRANAQLSAGPRSVEGKAASSPNSLKFGVHAKSLVIPGEEPEVLEALASQCENDFAPRDRRRIRARRNSRPFRVDAPPPFFLLPSDSGAAYGSDVAADGGTLKLVTAAVMTVSGASSFGESCAWNRIRSVSTIGRSFSATSRYWGFDAVTFTAKASPSSGTAAGSFPCSVMDFFSLAVPCPKPCPKVRAGTRASDPVNTSFT
jgi:hypothetical protein